MSTPQTTSTTQVVVLLLSLAAGLVAGGIMAATNAPPIQAILAENDRSRWVTIRALVEQGTYAIGRRDPALVARGNPFGEEGLIRERGWDTIDKVLVPDTQVFYSSKPPLLPTLIAGEYWLLRHLFGWSITDEDSGVIRTILFTVNWVPFLIYLVLLDRLVHRLASTSWARIYVLTGAAFGTYMLAFGVTLNNHTIAAWTALIGLYAGLIAWRNAGTSTLVLVDGTKTPRPSSRWPWVAAGFFSAFSGCAELPALAFPALWFLILAWRDWRRALAWFLPAAAVPVLALLVTNYLAIGKLTPAYSEMKGEWYHYPGSYWEASPNKSGLDWANESKDIYAFHLLLGHHGLFSLTPMFLLAPAGIAFCWWRRRKTPASDASGNGVPPDTPDAQIQRGEQRLIGTLTLVLTVTIIAFHIAFTTNYGGGTSGPRWFLWLTPFLLLSLVPVLDRLSELRFGRGLAYVLLALSVLSISYPSWNPWRNPWLFDVMDRKGWIEY